MVALFREKSILAIFGLVFFVLFVHMHIFYNPVQITLAKNSGAINLFLEHYASKLIPLVLTIIFPVLIFFQSLRLNIIFNNSRMYAKQGYTIAFAYILFTGLITSTFNISAALIINSFIILLFSLVIKLYNNPNASGLIFNIGFLTSAMVIGYYPCVVLIPFLFIAIIILKPFRPNEWFIMLMGIIAPIYLLFGILYLCNFDFKQIVLYKIKLFIELSPKDIKSIINLSSIVFLTLISIFIWYPNSNKLVIQIRKNWGVVLVLFLVLVASIPLYSKYKMLPVVVTLVPLSAMLANLFVYPKKLLLVNILVLMALGVVIYNNFS